MTDNNALLKEILNLKELITQKNEIETIVSMANKQKGVYKMPYIKEGTLFKRKNGYWESRIYINGKQKFICSSKLQKVAVEKLKIAIELKKKGQLDYYKNSNTLLLFEWLNNWLETYKKPYIVEKTYNGYKNIIQNHLKKHIKNIDLAKIETIDLQKCINNIQLSRTKESVFSVINSSFEKAYKLKLIKENPANFLEYKKHKRQNRTALSQEQQKEFLKVIQQSKFKNLFLFYLLTGTRKNEPLLSKWTDLKEKENTFIIRGTKTENSLVRPIPLYNDLKQLLNEIKSEQKNKSDYIFTMSETAIQKEVEKIKTKLSFHFSLHLLRHTFATNCVEKNINIKAVQKWLGHKNMSTTEKIYTHISNEFEQNEIKKLD